MKKLLLFLFCIPFLGITQNSHTINTLGNTFSPSILTINVGDTVTWNNTGGSHNVNATQAIFQITKKVLVIRLVLDGLFSGYLLFQVHMIINVIHILV